MNSRPQDERPDREAPQPEWTEQYRLCTVDAQGGTQNVTVRVGAPSAAVIEFLDERSRTLLSGTDYRDCLTQLRRRLEQEGRLLCCQGARSDVHASGQLRQFTNGLQAYVLPAVPQAEEPTTVDIFAPAPPTGIVSLEAQRTALLAYWNLPA